MRYSNPAGLLLLLCLTLACNTPQVILDTDIDSDVDDVEALALLNIFHNTARVDLRGVVITSRDRHSFAAADVINTYYGNGDLPIGFLRHRDSLLTNSRYTAHLAESFPHTRHDSVDTEEAVSLYRRLLADGRRRGTTIVTIGHLTSFAALLASTPDGISPLTGRQLVRQKVRRWICMGGQYPRGKEANFYRPDPASTGYALDHFPGKATFVGWEVGEAVLTGGPYLRNRLPGNSPVYQAYAAYNNFAGRSSWDQLAVLLLDKEARRRFFTTVTGYRVTVDDEGANDLVPDPSSRHRYLRLAVAPTEIALYIDSLVIDHVPK